MSNETDQRLAALERDFDALVQLIKQADTLEDLDRWVREERWQSRRLSQ